MSANQTPDYRPVPITQRDGSTLQNSNCRMASIATGLDFDTLGKKKSTGKAMRSHQSDQDGGTDSGDAQRAWANGYGEVLDVEDGKLWADVLTDLRQFRVVHLDVWHRTVGGPCLSGTGAYGHTIVVAPDCKDNEWLVADPWCKPAKWSRVSESKLKAGAEEWGRRIYGAATSGPGATDHPTLDQLRYVARRLMSRYHPGDDGEEDPSEDPGDTGGGQRVMYTVTAPHAPTSGGTDVGPTFLSTSIIGKATVSSAISIIATSDGEYHPVTVGTVRDVSEVTTITDGKYKGSKAYLVKVPGSEESGLLLASAASYVPSEAPTPEPIDCAPLLATAVATRDGAWREWLLEGSPGQRVRSRMDATEEA